MMINVFDDRKGSVAHILAGGITRFIPVMFVIFIAYEFIEHIYLAGKEKEANFLGDILEYAFGTMLMAVFCEITPCTIAVPLFVVAVAWLWHVMGKWKECRG